jgi:hypothetical protein
MISKKNIRILGLAFISLWASGANAALDFTVESFTANSLTFSVTGDMNGYLAPPAYTTYLTILYEGAIWSGGNVYPADKNVWSSPVFDPGTITQDDVGLTLGGVFDLTYTAYSASLDNGTILTTNQPITVTFERDFLNASATTGTVRLVWGYPPGQAGYTELDAFTVGVPASTTTTTTTTSAGTTTTTAPATTTTAVVFPTPRPIPALSAFGIPLLAGIMAIVGMFGFYRRK